MTGRVRVAICCSAVAVLAGIGVVATFADKGGVEILVRMPREEPIGEFVAARVPDFDFVVPEIKYDGRYFYAIALDGFATGEPSELIDHPAYRYGHPGYGWVTRLVSLGRLNWLPWALLITSLAGIAVAAGVSSLLVSALGLSAWGGLFIAANPGLLFAVSVDTAEALGAGVLVTGLLMWWRGRYAWAGALFAFLCFVKEPLVLVPLGLLLWEGIRWLRGDRPIDLPKRAAVLLAGPVLLAGWFVYVRSKFDEWPFSDNPDNIGAPFAGWWRSMGRASEQALTAEESQLGSASLILLMVVAIALLVGAVRAARLRSSLDVVYLLTVALLSLLTPAALLYPKDLFRNTWLALAILPWIFLVGREPSLQET